MHALKEKMVRGEKHNAIHWILIQRLRCKEENLSESKEDQPDDA